MTTESGKTADNRDEVGRIVENPTNTVEKEVRAFHALHQERYGHRMDIPVELVNLRMAVTGPAPRLVLAAVEAVAQAAAAEETGEVRHYRRDALIPGELIRGPAIISEQVATTWLAGGWNCRMDEKGSLLLRYS